MGRAPRMDPELYQALKEKIQTLDNTATRVTLRGMFGIRVKTGHKPLLKMCVQEKQPVAWWSKLACTHHVPQDM